MALSANLFLRQSQSLVMTPQLMQSIQLLQMTHMELTQFISREVEKNPLLDFAANDAESGSDERGGDAEPRGAGDSATEEFFSGATASPDDYRDTATGDAPGPDRLGDHIDGNFENVFPDDMEPRKADAPELLGQWKSMPGNESGEGYDLDDFVAGRTTLRDHIDQQIAFLFRDPGELLVARLLADQLDEAGYLHIDSDEISAQTGSAPDNLDDIVTRLQTLDPPGVFARSLGECLGIQLRQKDRLDPAMAALLDNLELLARRDFASLKKLCGVDEEDILDMLGEIRMLNPKPGAGFEPDIPETIVPDVVVRPGSDGSWLVEMNPDTLPRVLINQTYFEQVSKAMPRKGEEQGFLSECMQNAHWLTRSLDQRARTIMKVATEIVRQQDGFLTHGVDHLRPLNLKTVADAIKMHESTVSRVTSNKYMLTPRGLLEFKYFFTVSIGSAEGGDSHSAEAVRHRIRTMISQETPDAVLSDDDIVDHLKKAGIELARRTVAKYREAMNIPSSVQRRREKRAMAKAAS